MNHTSIEGDAILEGARPGVGSGVNARPAHIEACTNCEADLRGAFCHACGQPTRHFIRFFPAVVREVAEDTLGVDGRFWRTFVALLFRPGRLTLDYLNGKRVYYSSPVRLYLLTSLVAFLLITNMVDSALDEQGSGIVVVDRQASVGMTEQASQAAAGMADGEVSETSRTSDVSTEEGSTGIRITTDVDGDDDIIAFGSEPWDAETNPLVISWLPQSLNQSLNDEIADFKNKLPQIKENPRLLVDLILEILPQTMFILLPLFALILKFYYLFARRFYMEHFLFALHNHAFVFALLALMTLLDWLVGWVNGSADTPAWLNSVFWLSQVWLFVYLFLAQKRVYQQGWIMTSVKYGLVGFSYSILLVFALTGASLVGLVLV